MNNRADLEQAERQLDRVLGFFSRIENKSSFLLGANVGLIALMFYNVDYIDFTTWYIAVPFFTALVMVAFSMAELYRAAYPQLSGGSGSLIYFSSIAGKTESNFISECVSCSLENLRKDILGQVWRNSQILAEKFKRVKNAFTLTLFSTVPWTIFLLISSVVHARVIVLR